MAILMMTVGTGTGSILAHGLKPIDTVVAEGMAEKIRVLAISLFSDLSKFLEDATFVTS